MLIENIIGQNGIIERDKVKIAIERLKAFEPEEGYYLCFSGGKDSQCIYHLAKEGGIKFDAHYNHTGLDYPELIYFMRKNYPDVIVDYPKESMWKLIERKGLPTRVARWCCSELKERGGTGRLCVTGIRWAESNARSKRRPFEIVASKLSGAMLFNDNDSDRRLFETCVRKGKRVVNPIIDWEEEDVWEYLNGRNIEHCKLYDEGFSRLGCIGCPMGRKNREREFSLYPKYKIAYEKAVGRFIPNYIERCAKKGIDPLFNTTEEMMNWWLSDNEDSDDSYDNQMSFEDVED